MKENKPKERTELHVIINPLLLKKLRLDAVKEGVRTGQLVERILTDYYTK